MLPQRKKPASSPEVPQRTSTFDPRSVSWTNTRSDEAWAKMMRGGRNLTPSVSLPFEKPAQGGQNQ